MTANQLNSASAALLLIDHQVGTIGMVQSIPSEELKQNVVMLAKAATILGMPAVMTSSMEQAEQGPIIEELAEASPYAHQARIKRTGIINAMNDKAFAQAVEATGRTEFVVAGVTNDVCTVFPALTLLSQGYGVFIVADAGGSPTAQGDELALNRLRQSGAVIVGTGQAVAELTGDWSSPQGQRVMSEVIGSAMSQGD